MYNVSTNLQSFCPKGNKIHLVYEWLSCPSNRIQQASYMLLLMNVFPSAETFLLSWNGVYCLSVCLFVGPSICLITISCILPIVWLLAMYIIKHPTGGFFGYMRHQHDVPMNSCTWRVHLRTNIYLLMKDMLWTSVFAVSYEEPLSSLVASYDKQRVLATSPNYTFFRSQCMAKQFDSRSQNKAGEPKQQNYLCWVNLWYVLEHRFGYWAHNFF